MTDQELKDLVASLAIDRKETERMMQETISIHKENERLFKESREEVAAMHKENDRLFKESCQEARHREQEAAQQMKELREGLKELKDDQKEFRESLKELRNDQKELRESLKELGVQVGGVSNNIGYHAEQFFQDIFKKRLEFGRIKYDEMIPNLAYKDRGVKIEFDVVLLNGNSIALIEVKNRIHPSFVKELAEERIEMFREFFPRYGNYNAYLGIAGFSFSDEVLDQASRYGIGIIKQVGEGIEVEANNLKAY
jgi:DNA repair exonuclease SbcCD ATPase subunit